MAQAQAPPNSPPANNSTRADPPLKRSPLITEPLSNHSVSTMLTAIRTAIENGADVNEPDTELRVGYNEGRPLDACLRAPHMPSSKDIRENLPVIELLLEHGADPRLYSRSVGAAPMRLAMKYAVDETTEDGRAFWKHLLVLFEEAITRLDVKKTEAAGTDNEVEYKE